MPTTDEENIIAALPAEGSITYDALKTALDQNGTRRSLNAFQKGLIRKQFEATLVDGVFRVGRLGAFPADAG